MTRRLFVLVLSLVVYVLLVILAFMTKARYIEPAGAVQTANPKCYSQRVKCDAHLPAPTVGVRSCTRNPGQVNAGCLGQHKTPRYRPPIWLWRYTVRWTA